MADESARQALGSRVAQQVAFDRATSSVRQPRIEGLPVDLFLNATQSSAQQLARRLLTKLCHDESLIDPVFSISVIPVSDSGSEFYAEIECNDAADKQAVPLAGGLSIAELYDGNLAAFLDMIQSECGRFGKVTNHITYMPFSCIRSNEWCDPIGSGYAGPER